MAALTCLCLTWSHTSEDLFSRDKALLLAGCELLLLSAGKELTSWLSDCAVFLYAILIVCVPFLFGAGCGN